MTGLRSNALFDITATLEGWLDLFGVELADLRVLAVKTAILWFAAYLAWRVVLMIAARIVAASDDGDDTRLSYHEKRAQTIAALLKGVGKIGILVVTLLLTLNQFINLAPLLAGAGILGLAFSFGAQSLVKDVIAGFFILMENQFAIGDVIEVAGLAGGVEKMTLRVVVLRDLHGTVHVIPNGQITTVSNRTRGWARSVLDIGIAYDANVDHAIAVLTDEARRFGEDTGWANVKLDGMPEVVGVQSLADSAVNIRVMMRTQPGLQWEVGREFLRRAKNRLDQEGIEIPFPQRTVHVRHHGPDGALIAPPADAKDPYA
ncbi:MAG: mechanosensitive ion channel family protein [Gemmatimonadales bacterium]|jgi:small conductance mechanosensitive channel|nr:mechanosensitive ion channel family protein [Gemmatimonadales bacterium]MDZ4388578.1 mechanosensitive ion channel family protein [Gemmatimonadales bacterium]PKL94054.1 MAG: mechanosensitive ion channel family protein [Gemmatimonadetes bacterium HGW-Gemmatimonadetes-1]